ncbi:MAG: hypothetical protein LBI42_13480 [Chitinispirillales bacterium]|jgi:hypothetical protein|nr:hypothetical protein [Chitinispirillales bacterium]
MYSHPDSADQNITVTQAKQNKIEAELNKLSQTYVDTRELAAYIATERTQIRLQTVKTAQYQSSVEINYANLLSHDKEIWDGQALNYEHSIQVLFAGAEGYERYYGGYLLSKRE